MPFERAGGTEESMSTGLSRASLALRDPDEAERALADYFPSLRLGRAEPGAFRSWISTRAAPERMSDFM
ncbi:hypothetical protein ASE68_10160 [Agromyces sp. Leaf222]|nr:hypothetical protein ASE68_10160 [Agromyces sp. Leaf222]